MVARFYARKLTVSSRHLNRLCREWYGGKGIFEVVTERICMEAEVLLPDSGLLVKVVAYELGFSSTQHFRVYFKQHRGMTPSEFEKESKKTEVAHLENKDLGLSIIKRFSSW
ncbi:helix-turn-helix domain-containing protein [Pedobacter sp. LMG 31464]|uniref:Helix-turn-helix domain-containing protein n=1 Tax=Pedobacter planticolens TaxID=2679964 RepID=A0A923IVF2_9SPHI|nr:helix-turn-helix domain-containing protein [Pedobacter planticolens]MBB2145798.1 helix-turn-helix domain-containing protein [Pedobacter planticolens]